MLLFRFPVLELKLAGAMLDLFDPTLGSVLNGPATIIGDGPLIFAAVAAANDDIDRVAAAKLKTGVIEGVIVHS